MTKNTSKIPITRTVQDHDLIIALGDIAQDFLYALEHDLQDLTERQNLNEGGLEKDIRYIKKRMREVKSIIAEAKGGK